MCVVGAGAAGISLTRRLLARGHSVVLLESGGLDYEAPVANLNAGHSVGEEYYALADSRLRFFGGTTAIWGGRCAELDPIDLERRDYVPHSGWPFSWEELERWYAEARPLFGLPPRRPAPKICVGRRGSAKVRGTGNAALGFDRRFNRFAWERCKDLEAIPMPIVTHGQ